MVRYVGPTLQALYGIVQIPLTALAALVLLSTMPTVRQGVATIVVVIALCLTTFGQAVAAKKDAEKLLFEESASSSDGGGVYGTLVDAEDVSDCGDMELPKSRGVSFTIPSMIGRQGEGMPVAAFVLGDADAKSDVGGDVVADVAAAANVFGDDSAVSAYAEPAGGAAAVAAAAAAADVAEKVQHSELDAAILVNAL